MYSIPEKETGKPLPLSHFANEYMETQSVLPLLRPTEPGARVSEEANGFPRVLLCGQKATAIGFSVVGDLEIITPWETAAQEMLLLPRSKLS